MKVTKILIIIIIGLFAVCEGGDLKFEKQGFVIPELAVPVEQSPQQAVMLFLSAVDGFAPNVNVQIQQPFKGSIEDYASATERQLAQMKWTLLKKKEAEHDAVIFEYKGAMNGRELHWYAKAVKKGNKVYLVTATATETQWENLSGILKSCVDGFRLTEQRE